jgi:hypothetical protein
LDKLEEFFISNNIKQILVYKTKSILRVSIPFTKKMLDYITKSLDGKIVLLNENCIGQVEFEDIMHSKWGEIDHFIFSVPLIAVVLQNKKLKKEDNWRIFQAYDRKYFYKETGKECWVLNDEKGKFMKTDKDERLNITSSIVQSKQEKVEDKQEKLDKILKNNNYYKKEIVEVIKKIMNMVNGSIIYDSRTKVYVLKYGKTKTDIIDYLQTIIKLLNNI